MLREYLEGFEAVDAEGLAGTHIMVFARCWLVPYITYSRFKRTYTGFKGLTGSKGAVSNHPYNAGLYLHIGSRSYNFINCHLKADHDKTQKRNEGLARVL